MRNRFKDVYPVSHGSSWISMTEGPETSHCGHGRAGYTSKSSNLHVALAISNAGRPQDMPGESHTKKKSKNLSVLSVKQLQLLPLLLSLLSPPPPPSPPPLLQLPLPLPILITSKQLPRRHLSNYSSKKYPCHYLFAVQLRENLKDFGNGIHFSVALVKITSNFGMQKRHRVWWPWSIFSSPRK